MLTMSKVNSKIKLQYFKCYRNNVLEFSERIFKNIDLLVLFESMNIQCNSITLGIFVVGEILTYSENHTFVYHIFVYKPNTSQNRMQYMALITVRMYMFSSFINLFVAIKNAD